MEHRLKDWWDARYARGDAGWDIAEVAPPIRRLLDEERLEKGSALIVGCGRGHEAHELARRGFSVVALDWSRLALEGARFGAGAVRLLQGDVRRLPLCDGSFDYVLEHTCYCAIDPVDRPDYRREVTRVLKPGGRLLGLFYEPAQPQKPPFPVTREDIVSGFGDRFEIERLECPGDSIERRAGQEWLALLRKR
jgi:SAM-dependent methyltransferase